MTKLDKRSLFFRLSFGWSFERLSVLRRSDGKAPQTLKLKSEHFSTLKGKGTNL